MRNGGRTQVKYRKVSMYYPANSLLTGFVFQTMKKVKVTACAMWSADVEL